MAHTVLIDKREYSSCVLDGFKKMRENHLHFNFIIKVGVDEIQTHRNLLCAASDYFSNMLSHDTKENQAGIVEMIDVDPECVKICVDHIYGRQVAVPPEKYEQMMHIASLWQLNMLRDGIVALLEEKLDSRMFFVAVKIADIYDCLNLEEKCVEFAESNFPSISKEEKFVELDKNYIKQMVKSKSVKMTEEEKLDTLLKWVNSDAKKKKFFGEMLKSEVINLKKVSVEKRKSLMENHPLIHANLDLYQRFSISLMSTLTRDASSLGAFASDSGAEIYLFDKLSGHLQLFDVAKKTLTQKQEMNDEMKQRRFSAVLHGDHIYVLMRNKLVFRLNYLDEKATWVQVADMMEEHGSYPPVVTSPTFIYVVGGSLIHFAYGQQKTSSFVEKYDSTTNKWTKVADKPESTKGSEVLASGEYIYCFGGVCGLPEFENSVQRLNLDSTKWEDLLSMNEKRTNVGVVEVNGKIYVMGGLVNKQKLQSVEKSDPEEENWTMLKPMISPRSKFRCFYIDGWIYAVGGDESKSTIEKYDVKEDIWEMVDLPIGTNVKISDSVVVDL